MSCKHKWIPLGKDEHLGSLASLGIKMGSSVSIYFYCENCLELKEKVIRV